MSKLVVSHVSKRFGGLQALHDVSLETEGEILGLIGPNGAGKTTLFNIISGFHKPTEGEVRYGEHVIQRHSPHQIVDLGVARTLQIVKPFSDLNVLDNVLSGVGAPIYPRVQAFWRRYRQRGSVDAAQEILDLTGLTSFADARADSLPIGLQRRLEIARALATGPSLLLLDEPAAGLVSQEADELADLIRVIHGEGKSIVKSIVVIEHNMTFAMGLCQRIIALDQGQVIAEGEPAAVRADEQVINVYLGRRRNHA